MAAGGTSLSTRPVLKIRHDDISRSWKEWYDEFQLSIRLMEFELGNETVKIDEANVTRPKFTKEAKLLALLKCIGIDGRSTLAAAGYSISSTDLTYDMALGVLKKHYERKESLYVRTQKFVTVRQCAGEEYSSYLLRVEKLSRALDFFEHNTDNVATALQGARQHLALVLAVNGLRDQVLCRELIAKDDLTWDTLGTILRSRAKADDTVDKLSDNRGEKPSSVKNEINLVSHRSRSSSREDTRPRDTRPKYYRRRDYRHSGRGSDSSRSRERYGKSRYSGTSDSSRSRERYDKPRHTRNSDRSWSRDRYRDQRPKDKLGNTDSNCYECRKAGHSARYWPKVKCYRCHRLGHVAKDCGESRCWRCGGKPHSSGGLCPKSRSPSPFRREGGRTVKFMDQVDSSS